MLKFAFWKSSDILSLHYYYALWKGTDSKYISDSQMAIWLPFGDSDEIWKRNRFISLTCILNGLIIIIIGIIINTTNMINHNSNFDDIILNYTCESNLI